MLFKEKVTGFVKCEDGAVTVDWVVLTAAVMLLGIAVGGVIATNVNTAGDNIGTTIASSTTP